jgi:hypothetical protein
MRENESFDILHDGVPRTSRDQKAMAYEAARFAKTQNPADIIEMVDRSNGTTSRRKDCWTLSPKKCQGISLALLDNVIATCRCRRTSSARWRPW